MRSFLIVFSFLVLNGLLAQTASNKDCAHALPLVVATGNLQSDFVLVDGEHLSGAVPDPLTACSGGGTHGSAWFSFTATATKHWIRTEGDALDQSSMEVFSGSCGSLTSVACFPSFGATPALTGLNVGSTYFLRVVTLSPSSCFANDCQVWVAVVSSPLNDECGGAFELPVTTNSISVNPATEISSLGATQSQAACTGGAGASNDDVWYRFTATHTTHFLPTMTLSGDDPIVQWFSGGCGNLTSIGCNVDEVSGLSIGEQYHIRMHSASTSATVSTRALAGVFVPAANDECADAWPITVAQGVGEATPVRLSTINSTSSAVPCGTAAHDVWLTFTAPGDHVTVVSDANTTATVYSGSCGSLVCVASGAPLQPDWTFQGLTTGQTYFLKIGGSSGRNTAIRLYAPPENNECTSAVPLDLSAEALPGYTFGATQSLPPECGGQAKDVWYRFTAANGRHVVQCARTLAPDELLYVETFSGVCGSLTSLTCAQSIGGPVTVDGLVAGSTYFIRVMAGDQTAFRIAVRPAAENDECEGATVLPYSTLADYETIAERDNQVTANGTSACDAYHDTWFKFTAAHSSAAFIAPGISGPGTGVELLSGTCGSLTSLDCRTDMTNVRVRFTGLTVGTEYRIRLSTLSNQRYRPMLIDQHANDAITGALSVPVGGSAFTTSLFEASNYAASQSCALLCDPSANPDDDTWFRFTATAPTHTIATLQRNIHFTEPAIIGGFHIEVYDTLSTECDTLDAHVVGCGDSPVVVNGLIPGKDYWYRVYTSNVGVEQTCVFTTAVRSDDNDEASGAFTLTYDNAYTAIFNTAGATQSQPGANCNVNDVADDDIWFKFVATNAPARLVVGYHTADLTLELFSGTPGNLTSIACDGNVLVLPTLIPGQTYYARSYSWGNATPVQGRIGLFITPPLTDNGCVDFSCLGPVLLSNPSIEQGTYCPAMIPEIGFTSGLGTTLAPGWPRMQSGSSDAFCSCSDHAIFEEVPSGGLEVASKRVLSRSGKGMAGIIVKDFQNPDYHEYIQAPLTEALVPGEPYLVSFHTAILTENHLCINGLGAALSKGPIAFDNYNDIIPVAPTIVSTEVICTDQWVNICGVVVPDEAVDHITIGPFFGGRQFNYQGQYINRSYYFIDDVVVAHIDDANCITGIGDVPPMAADDAGSKGDDLRLYPNPANDRVNIVCDAALFGKRGVIEVFDATGKRVYMEEVAALMAVQPLQLQAIDSKGLYLVQVRVAGQAPKQARLLVER